MLRDDVPVVGLAPIELLESKTVAAIARALAPLRWTVSNPPTEADVKAVADRLDALLMETEPQLES
jgi:hypothetical protein